MPTPQDLHHLFDYLWPAMHAAAAHRDRCLANLGNINALFARHQGNPDALLVALVGLDGIGPTIASGLIYSSNRTTMVPFDRFTMGYALQLRLALNNFLTRGNYSRYSQAVVAWIHQNQVDGGIEGFVRQAGQQCLFPIEPA